ncbi:intermembrane phospholipid transport protein YdbH family protein [Algihabitans albus]|uniref:intermembrane phospholipid transport protein YdbH family protein n=1 Tax=Algihabitans albus TaxID=2164067 RepID=UPI000E5C8722|nr:YdbH domain-containing protein [Algihabitans albus]
MRRLAFVSLILLVFLLGLASGAWLFRMDLAEIAAQRWLAARGVPIELTVTRLDVDGVRITDLKLGGAPVASARVAQVEIAWPRWREPEVAGLTVESGRLNLNLTGDGPLLGELQPLFETAGTEAPEETTASPRTTEPAAALPSPAAFPGALPFRPFPVEVSDMTILARTALGPATLRLDGKARPDGEGLATDVTLQGVTPVAVFGGQLQAEATPQGLADLQTDLQFAAEDQGLEGRLIADLSDLPASPSGQLTVDLTAGPRTAALLAPLLPKPVTWRDLRLTIDLEGQVPQLPADPVWQTWLQDGDWSAAMTLTANDFAWPDGFSGGQLLLVLDAKLAKGILTVLPAQTAELSIPRPDPTFLAELGLPEDLREQLLDGIGLRLQPLDAGDPLLAIERGPETTVLRPALRVGLETGPSAAAAALRGNLSFNSNLDLQFIDLSEFNFSLSNWTLAGHKLNGAAISGRLAGPPDALLGVVDISGEGVPELPGAVAETVALHWPADLQGDLAAKQLRLSGPLALDALALANEELSLASFDSRLQADLTISPEGLDLTAPGYLEAGDLRFGQRRIAELRATLEQNEVRWSPGGPLNHRQEARWSPVELRILEGDRPLLEADLKLGRWQVGGTLEDAIYEGGFSIDEASVGLQEPPLRVEALRLGGALPLQAGAALDLAGRLTHTAEVPLLPPLDLAGSLEPEEAAYEVAVTGRGLGGRVTALARATIDPDAPRLRADLTLAPVVFAPETLQPGDLTPLLSDLTSVSGRLAATLGLDWTADGPRSRAEVTLEGLNFDYGDGIRVSGLSGGLEFASLMPLNAPPPQRLSAARIETLFPLTDLIAEVGVATPAATGSPRLQIVSARARALGGWLSLEQGVIDPASNREEAVLGLERIDIAELLAVLNAPDVEATGRISGEIPIRLEGNTVTIAEGRLAAEEPGSLRLTSEAAKQALAAGGQSVDLMMQALENFEYQELALTLDKPAEGTTLVTLKLLGQNPDVLDGQPFDVAVRLETDLAPLLLALSQALALTDGAIEHLWRLRR